MSVCLRCDGCGKVVAESDGDMGRWWRLERYGLEWIVEPGSEAESTPQVEMHSVVINNMGTDGTLYSEEELLVEEEAILDEIIEEDLIESIALHFCSAECLSGWAAQAAEFEK